MKKIDYDLLFPEVPEKVSSRIDDVVQEHLNDNVVEFHEVSDTNSKAKNSKAKNSKSMRRLSLVQVAAAIAAVIIIPTGVYAANQAYKAYVEKKAAYSYNINVVPGENETTGAQVESPKRMQLNYVPEDLYYNEDGPYGGKYTANPPSSERGMTPVFMMAPEGGINQAVDYATETSEWTTESGNKVMFFRRQVGYDQVWIAFADTKYVGQIYVNGFTEEEVKRLAEGAILVDADEEIAGVWREPETAIVVNEPERYVGKLVSVGDTIHGVSSDFNYNVDIKIDSVVIQDDFAGVTTDPIGREENYDQYVGEDGKILVNRKFIKSGDGKENLNRVVGEDQVHEKVVVMEMTVTNLTEKQLGGLCIFPRLVHVFDKKVYYWDILDTDKFDKIVRDHAGANLCVGEMFSFNTEHYHIKNSINDIVPGESVKVKVAFLVDEDMLDNAYIELMPSMTEKEGNVYIAVGE